MPWKTRGKNSPLTLRAEKQLGFALDGDDFLLPDRHDRPLKKNWPGPAYLPMRRKRWRADLRYVTEQLRCLVRVNAPLVKGVEALVREEARQASPSRAMTRGSYATLFMAILYTVLPVSYVGLYAWQLLRLEIAIIIAVYLLCVGLLSVLWRNSAFWRTRPFALVFLIAAFMSLLAIYVIEMTGDKKLILYDLIREPELMALSMFLLFLPVVLLVLVLLLRPRTMAGKRETVLLALRNHLAEGASLSEAMRRLPRFFPPFFADMAAVGENSGRLEECLHTLTEETVVHNELRRSIRPALIYVGLVGLIQLAIILFLVTRVFPVFSEIVYEFSGQSSIPPSGFLASAATGLVNGIEAGLVRASRTFKAGVAALIFLVSGAGVLLFLMLRSHRFPRRWLMGLLLYVPGLSGMVRRGNLGKIALVLERLLQAGVPLENALEQAASCDLGRGYRRMVTAIRARILQGESLAAACAAEQRRMLSLRSFSGMIAVGEHAGMLPEALRFLSDTYTNQLRTRVRVAAALVQPLCTLLLGFLTLLFVYYACSMLFGVTEIVLEQVI